MIKKLTRNLLSTILTVLLAVGVFGIATPKEVHAAGGGIKVTASYAGTTYTIVSDASINDEITLATIKSKINVGSMSVQKSIHSGGSSAITKKDNTTLKIASTGNDWVYFAEENPPKKAQISVYFTVTQEHTHSWSVTASGNTITTKCVGSGTCPQGYKTEKELTLNADEKTYNGSGQGASTSGSYYTQAGTLGSISYTGIGGTSYSGTTAPKNAGNYRASVSLGGKTATKDFTISPKEIGLNWDNLEFTYDKQSHAPTATATGLASGDSCTVTVGGAQTNAGTHTATAASLNNSNYKLPTSNTKQFTINPKELTLSGVTAEENRIYNGTKIAKLNTGSEDLEGVFEGDDVSIDTIEGLFENKNVGNSKQITVNATLEGAAKDNYTIKPVTGLTGNIHHLPTTVSGITANNKTYDGTTNATIDTSSASFKNMVTGDNLTIAATGEFVDANVEEGKTVNLTLGSLGGADAGNYILDADDSQQTATASITPKAMTVNASGYEDKWDGNPHSITVTVTEPTGGYTITYKGPNDSDYKEDNPTFTDPGTYEVAYKVTAPNYTVFEGSETVNIIGKDFVGISSSPYEGVYDGRPHMIGINIPMDLEFDSITFADSESGPYKDEPTMYVDFTNGEKTMYFKVSKVGYNDFIGSNTVNITQKEIGLSWGTNTFTYDGKAHVPTATATGLVVDTDTCKVTVTGEQTDSNVKTKTENYTATATALSNNNYKLPENVTKEFTIAQKEVSIEWTDTELTYNGKTQKPTATATNLVVGDECEVTVKGEQKDSNAKSGEDKYTATATELSDANYKLPSEVTKDFTIAQKEITVDGITHLGKTYDGTTDATEKLYYEDEHLVGKITGDKLDLKAKGTFVDPNVGKDIEIILSDFELTGDDKDNYVLASTGQQETTKGNISTKYLTITAHDKEKFYGGVDPEFTYDAQGLIVGDEITGSLSRRPGENVGGHTITLGTLHAGGNYAIDYTHGTLTIKKATENNVTANITGWTYGDPANPPGATGKFGADTATFTYSDSADGEYSSDVPTQAGTYYVKATVEGTDNYPGAVSEPVEFKIAQKEIGLTWGKTAFTYTGEAQKPTATATNLVVGDECEVTVDGAQIDSNAKTETENYTATASITNPNYKLPQDPTTTFTIAQKEVTVSGITAKDKTYDRNDKAELNYDEVVLDEIVGQEEVSVEATGTFEDKNAKEDKTVTISNLTLTGKDAGNYILASEGQQKDTTATINKKPIKVTANEHEKYYGDDDPTELTYEVDPELVEGDEFTGSLVREEGEDVGDYDIEEGTLSAGNNYDIDYTPNTFVILQADNSVTASIEGWTYGDKANEPSATADFGEDNVVFTYSDKEDGDYSEDVPTQAGTYYLKASIAETNNYKGATSVPVEFTIDQKEVELEWSDTDLTYNGKAQKPKATVTNLVDKDECEVTVEGEKKDSNIKTGTDSYTATATKLSNPNYKLPSEVTKDFTISPKQLTSDMLSVDPESVKNDGTKKGPKITLNDKEAGVDLTDDDYDLSGETESDKSGTHFFEVEGKGNYTGTLSSSWVMYENRQNHDKQKGTDGKGDIEIFVDVVGNTENITVDNFTIDFAKKLLSEEDLERYNNGENVLIYVELEEESKDDVDANYKELILSEFNKVAAKDIRWFDITVWKRIGNDKATQVHDTIDNLEMTISVPDEYKNAPADNTRTFYLARSHDGEADILTKTNEKKVGLSSNKFSIYALAYKDTYHGSKYIVPKTGVE